MRYRRVPLGAHTRVRHPARTEGPTLATADVYYPKPSPTQGNPLIGAVPDTVSVYKTCLRADPTPYTIYNQTVLRPEGRFGCRVTDEVRTCGVRCVEVCR